MGIKHSRRAGADAAFSVTVAAFQKFAEKGYDAKEVELVLKGFGKLRAGFLNALLTPHGERISRKVVRITDSTPLQIGRITAPRKKRS